MRGSATKEAMDFNICEQMIPGFEDGEKRFVLKFKKGMCGLNNTIVEV